mgnify:CR=1 FL=1
MEIVNYTKFRAHLKHWLDKATNDVSEIIIKRKDDQDLVLVSKNEYNALKETPYLLSGDNRNVLLNSINELESGRGCNKALVN